MDILRNIIELMVVCVGFVGWSVFLPQIKLLLKEKEARSISLGLVWGSFAMQVIIFIHTILKKDWHLTFAIGTSLICLTLVLRLVYYYRKYPGGRW